MYLFIFLSQTRYKINQKNGIDQCKSSLYLIYDHMTNINKKKQIMEEGQR